MTRFLSSILLLVLLVVAARVASAETPADTVASMKRKAESAKTEAGGCCAREAKLVDDSIAKLEATAAKLSSETSPDKIQLYTGFFQQDITSVNATINVLLDARAKKNQRLFLYVGGGAAVVVVGAIALFVARRRRPAVRA